MHKILSFLLNQVGRLCVVYDFITKKYHTKKCDKNTKFPYFDQLT